MILRVEPGELDFSVVMVNFFSAILFKSKESFAFLGRITVSSRCRLDVWFNSDFMRESVVDIVEKITKRVQKALESSKDLLDKAKEQARDISETGVAKYEIKTLKDSRAVLIRELGETVYTIFISCDQQTISRKTSGVKELMLQLESVSRELEEKIAELPDDETTSGA